MPDLASCDFDPASISVTQATAHIRQTIVPVSETETLNLRDARGRVLAEDAVSRANVPNHTNSAMDGYAFAGDAVPQDSVMELIGTAMAEFV